MGAAEGGDEATKEANMLVLLAKQSGHSLDAEGLCFLSFPHHGWRPLCSQWDDTSFDLSKTL